MGLGGYLAWTAVAREVSKKLPDNVKILTCEGNDKGVTKIIRSPVFENNPRFYKHGDGYEAFPLFTNNPEANYCKTDTPIRAHHRGDKHMIEQMCEVYNIKDPELKCEIFFSNAEEERVGKLLEGLDSDFVTIEPNSKMGYTFNRSYPLKKWQKIVDALKGIIQIVQVGTRDGRLLDGVVDYRGLTSFREAAILIGKSKMFLSTEGGLVHAATAVDTTALVIITGYQDERMVAYPQNININIATHGPCGLKLECPDCKKDRLDHNFEEIVEKARERLGI